MNIWSKRGICLASDLPNGVLTWASDLPARSNPRSGQSDARSNPRSGKSPGSPNFQLQKWFESEFRTFLAFELHSLIFHSRAGLRIWSGEDLTRWILRISLISISFSSNGFILWNNRRKCAIFCFEQTVIFQWESFCIRFLRPFFSIKAYETRLIIALKVV